MIAAFWIKRHVAWPADHGAWVLLLSPLAIGVAAGGSWRVPSIYLVVAALAGFLVRQPVTLIVRIYSGRRARRDLPAAWFWTVVYGSIATLHAVGLYVRGFGYVLWLAVPGLAVFAWYLALVARRRERRQETLEILAGGVLALSAPAAFWIGLQRAAPIGWLLWLLVWAQAAASILHAYMRLGQRSAARGESDRRPPAVAAVVVTTLNVALAAAVGLSGFVPRWLFVPYAVQWAETLLGARRPAANVRPAAIGLRQLVVSLVFTILFAAIWRY